MGSFLRLQPRRPDRAAHGYVYYRWTTWYMSVVRFFLDHAGPFRPVRDAAAHHLERTHHAKVVTTEDAKDVGSADALFEALWKRALEAWDDDKPHAAILEHALKNEKLPDLSGRYRALISDPEKGPRAREKIDRIIAAATQMLFATKTPERTKTPWQWSAAAFLVFALVSAYLFYQLFLPHRYH